MRFSRFAVAAFALALPVVAAAQDDSRFIELRFHRVHLRNGNVIDGQLLRQSAKEISLKLSSGEISVRMDLVDRVEYIKMKSLNEKAPEIPLPKNPSMTDAPPIKSTPGVPRVAPTASVKLDPATYEAVETLIAEYLKADVEQKQSVMDRLIKLGGNVPAYLVSVITRFDREFVPLVLNSVAQTKDRGLVPVLAAHLESDDPSLRVNIAMAMGMIADPSALPYLSACLKDKDAGVRSAGVTGLALLRSPDSFDPLLPLLVDPDREVRTRVIAVLHEQATATSRQKDLGDALGAAILKVEGDTREDLIFALGRGAHKSSWNIVAPFLRDDSANTRQAAAKALSELAVPDSADALFAAIQTERNASVQTALASAAQKLGLLRAGGTLIGWLENGQPETKTAAKLALTAISGQSLGDDLEKWKAWWDKAKPQ